MKTIDFIERYNPCCKEGRSFALQFEEMSEVWEKCKRIDWLFWIHKKHSLLVEEQSVKLANIYAKEAKNYADAAADVNAAYASVASAAAAAAAAYAAYAAAAAAAYAAASAAYAANAANAANAAADAAYASAASASADVNAAYAYADYAAYAAYAKNCNIFRSVVPNPFL